MTDPQHNEAERAPDDPGVPVADPDAVAQADEDNRPPLVQPEIDEDDVPRVSTEDT